MNPLNSVLVGFLAFVSVTVQAQSSDWRNIRSGWTIPDESYSDQPYVVQTDDGAWLCVLTTAAGHEGTSGQHVITQRSLDKGKTWGDRVDVEPSDGPEASYAVLLKAPGGRVFVFYNHNTDNVRWVKGDNPPYPDGQVKRVDSQGYFVFKYSDDHGKTWSAERTAIQMRNFEIDKNNPYAGEIQYFWNVGKAFSHKGKAYVPVHKVGGFGEGFFTSSEGALLCSSDLLSVADPKNASWETLPEGEIGLRTPSGGGTIAEEQSFVVLSDGSFFCVYRTIDGHAAFTYSRDEGRTWDEPQYMRYADGRLMKHPRAANFAWKCLNGKYLYWFHNHGGRFIREDPRQRSIGYNDRNPVWLAGGIEVESRNGKIIQWSQPEILFYDDDPLIRMSYPDLIEEDGSYYITETQKDIARVHLVDEELLERLWTQSDYDIKADEGVLFHWQRSDTGNASIFEAPWGQFPELSKRDMRAIDGAGVSTNASFSIDLTFDVPHLEERLILLDTREPSGKGWMVRIDDNRTLELVMSDGQTQVTWACSSGLLKPGQSHQVSIVVDGGPKVIYMVVDGKLDDGGDVRQFGWGRFTPHFRSANGSDSLKILADTVWEVTLYKKALSVTEAMGNYRASIK